MTNLKDYLNDLVKEIIEINTQLVKCEISETLANDCNAQALEDCMDSIKNLFGFE